MNNNTFSLQAEAQLALRAMVRAMGQDRQGRGVNAALLTGPAGCGKTTFAQLLAEQLGARLISLAVHNWTTDAELLYGVNVAEAVRGNADGVVQAGVATLAAQASLEGRVVLLLDEVDKAQEALLNAILDFMQSGTGVLGPDQRVQGNLSNLVVVLASNGQRELPEPLLRRVRRVQMSPLPRAAYVAAAQGQGLSLPVAEKLVKISFEVAQADDQGTTVQEVANLAAELDLAESLDELRGLIAQWAARGPKGQSAAARLDLAPLWGMITRARRVG